MIHLAIFPASHRDLEEVVDEFQDIQQASPFVFVISTRCIFYRIFDCDAKNLGDVHDDKFGIVIAKTFKVLKNLISTPFPPCHPILSLTSPV